MSILSHPCFPHLLCNVYHSTFSSHLFIAQCVCDLLSLVSSYYVSIPFKPWLKDGNGTNNHCWFHYHLCNGYHFTSSSDLFIPLFSSNVTPRTSTFASLSFLSICLCDYRIRICQLYFQDICEAARHYADALEKKLKDNNYYDDNPSYFGVSDSVCCFDFMIFFVGF
jgi:hypothetical protein